MNFTNILTATLILLLLTSVIMAGMRLTRSSGRNEGISDLTSIFDLAMPDINGEEVALSRFKGEVLLLVNVASKCGYTYQYEGLQTLYETYMDRGFNILDN